MRITEVVAGLVLAYFAFWPALALGLLVLVARNASRSPAPQADQPEWREGHAGFGLYDKTEWRHDMGDPDGS